MSDFRRLDTNVVKREPSLPPTLRQEKELMPKWEENYQQQYTLDYSMRSDLDLADYFYGDEPLSAISSGQSSFA